MALRIEHLTKTYNVGGRLVPALKDVSLQLPRGKTLAIVGESGSGKSTLVKAAIRLVESDSGHVWVGDTDFLALRGSALAANR
ncbi:MAG: ATP-binding cassette domain-containing protein, partial [Pseudomonas sp.]|nr:ATP-binding cassette domain-containing protein [Pseudomonas sp.]